jgi:hypothetical protein
MSAWAQDPSEPLLLGSAVRVVVAELNIREKPSTSGKRVDTFRADQVILVNRLIPPVDADGYLWYEGTGPFGDGKGGLLALPHDPYAGTDPTSGWFASSKGTTAYVAQLAPRCPSAVDIVNLGAMVPAERLACFGRTTIEFEASYRYGCPTCEIFGRFEPAWLSDPNIGHFVAESGTGFDGPGLDIAFPPRLAAPKSGAILRLRGHFDDPAAADCSMGLVAWDYVDMEPDPVPPSVARLWCRQQLVVESFDVIGTDETYEP